MKIALLHDSFWPEIGGVEQVMRDQADMLQRAGHDVTVFTGNGADPETGFPVYLIAELAPDFPLRVQVQSVLDQGQADQSFNQYRTALVEVLRSALADIELTLVHDHFTVHRNLALTRALHDLAPGHRLIAWTHHLVAGNPDYAMPNSTQPPWNLMCTSAPSVPYVAVSELRASELEAQLGPKPVPQVIPNPVSRSRLFGLSPEMRESYESFDLPSRDYVLLLPAPLVPRKNIEFAVEIVKQLVEGGHNPLLLVTGPRDPAAAAMDHYADFLRQSLPEELKPHVAFLSDFFSVSDEALRDLYLLADCLLYPSAREGFGLPVVEAAAFRLPIWCQDIPAYQALAEDGAAYPLEDITRLPDAVEWLESLPTFRQQRRARVTFDPVVIYRDYYEPLLASILSQAGEEDEAAAEPKPAATPS